jgi:outer membrane biosynthesis protein TonB
MKFNSKITLTLTLLALMLGVGTASAWCAMKLGEASLAGVSQPETNPTRKLGSKRATASELKEFVPVDEKAIVKKVKETIDELSNEDKKQDKVKAPKKGKDEEAVKAEKPKPDATPQAAKDNSQFPLKARNGNVTLEVVKASQQGDSIILDVALSNQGKQSVKFLYSFLEVKDTANRPLSAIVENLPEELPANGKTFSGTVRIPVATIEGGEKLSLNLTDYPEQKLNLSIANIPIQQE